MGEDEPNTTLRVQTPPIGDQHHDEEPPILLYPDEVRRYGLRQAVILSAIRAAGGTTGTPLVIGWTALGKLAGVSRWVTAPAARALQKAGALYIDDARSAAPAVLRLREGAARHGLGQGQLSRVSEGGLAQFDPQHLGGAPLPTTTSGITGLRLDTVRALLEAVD